MATSKQRPNNAMTASILPLPTAPMAKRLDAANRLLTEQTVALAAAYTALRDFVEAADGFVECVDCCDRARKVMAMIGGER